METQDRDRSREWSADLRRQHQAWLREGYDGHNRHGGITTMDQLRQRRRRRIIRRSLAYWISAYRLNDVAA
jgi:hypothetical protein